MHGEGALQCLPQVMANNWMRFDTLAKYSPGNSKKYAALLSVLVKEFKKRFQGCKKESSIFLYIFYSIFS